MTGCLISSQDLAEGLPHCLALDASVEKCSAPGEAKAFRAARTAYRRDGHIPGARFADLLDQFSDPDGAFPFTRPDAARFEAAARRLGASRDDRIVVYDRSNGIWAARLWWLFRAFGHQAVSVLDGGYLGWLREGRPIETGAGPFEPGTFTARERPGFFVDTPAVVDIVAKRRPAQLLNVLRSQVHTGREQAYARPGHIPGSSNVPYADCLEADTGRLLPTAVLRTRLAAVLADPTPIVTYCGGGITAAGTALVLARLGRDDVAIYDGSLNAWAADTALPLVVEPNGDDR